MGIPNRPAAVATAAVLTTIIVGSCSGGFDGSGGETSLASPAATTTQTTVGNTHSGVDTTTNSTIGPASPATVCTDLEIAESAPIVAEPQLTEISGAVVSARTPEAVWVHEDSGRTPQITELGLDGSVISQWLVPGIDMVDWEDIGAITADDRTRHLLIGDIGDNARRRETVQLIRVPEPQPHTSSDTTERPAVIQMRLPDGPRDAEALIVDQRRGDVVVLTKAVTGIAQVLVAPSAAWLDDGESVDLVAAGELTLGATQAVLAGDLSPDGAIIAVRTPSRVLLWPHAPERSIAETLLGTEPCVAPAIFDIQGEAIALFDEGYVLIGEGSAPSIVRVR